MNSSSELDTTKRFEEAVSSAIAQHLMLEGGETVVAAVSGGADSVALLHVLMSLKDKLSIEVVAAHLNHCIRSKDAEEDSRFVEEIAARLGIASVVGKIDVPKLSKELRTGLEDAARRARYDFLQEVTKNTGASKIAVAHTVDDQVETVLLNIIRGTGLDGLAGMPAVRDNIIRPLINVSRADVEEYLRALGETWRTDSTNLDTSYSRNRVRLELIPYIEEHLNPRVRKAVASLSSLAKDDAKVVRDLAQQAFESIATHISKDRVAIDATKLRQLARAIQRRCVRNAVEIVKGDLRDLEFDQVERIIDSVDVSMPFNLTLPSGEVYAALVDDELSIFRIVEPQKIEVVRQIFFPGSTKVPELGVIIDAAAVDPKTRPSTPFEVVLDTAKLAGPLYVRTWEPGDRIQPLGMSGHKKLQNLFTDRKIPRFERSRTPIITDDQKIVWVAGIAASELAKVSEDTVIAVKLTCSPLI